MKDLYCTIEFKKKGKLIWVLRCDEKSFERLENLINLYLVREHFKDLK